MAACLRRSLLVYASVVNRRLRLDEDFFFLFERRRLDSLEFDEESLEDDDGS
jgi:hypothetical protein